MTGPRGILFDFNGVLVDDEPQHCAAFIATLAEHDIVLDEATYFRDYLGFDDRACFAYAWHAAGRTLTNTHLKLMVKDKSARYEAAIRGSLTMVPGAVEFVAAAAAERYQLGVVSGALRHEIEMVLEVAGLRRHFTSVVAAEDVGICKPDPAGFLRGLSELALPGTDVTAIEDSLPGLAAARGAGLRCAMLSTSLTAAALSGADLVWSDLTGHRASELPWS